ncbi:hypothetical protein CEXT_690471 [Caerostris extrusa]|uniref:Uncharacterized protein n=1 Tax=Caerostris extrusa TaxID=172846 RepID=A0AAV4ML42_CAEEX|nr:hypothetical protein CEXT_690471 [Caerostris extrusa]
MHFRTLYECTPLPHLGRRKKKEKKKRKKLINDLLELLMAFGNCSSPPPLGPWQARAGSTFKSYSTIKAGRQCAPLLASHLFNVSFRGKGAASCEISSTFMSLC